MRLIGNILWIILGGIFISAAWLFLGILLCITVVGIPFGVQCFKFARLNLAPFGKDVRVQFFSHPIINALWAVFFGWEMALAYLSAGLACCVTIIGIPFGLQAFKMMKLALFPFGADVVYTI
ncbi:MAG: YccF domain-containing protein [Clostridia bacterium]|nr:YccF domain-containing protein [Clostridia bacterium]